MTERRAREALWKAYLLRHAHSIVRKHAELPLSLDQELRLGDLLDSPENLLVLKLDGGSSAGVEVGTVKAHLVWSLLKGTDPSANKSPD